VLVNIPGLTPIYDYEALPQEVCLSGGFPSLRISTDLTCVLQLTNQQQGIVAQYFHRALILSDALLVPSSTSLEREAMQALKQWLEPLRQTVLAPGPPNISEREAVNIRCSTKHLNEHDRTVISFLDRTQCTHGEKALIFVRL
jgi:hypothetical protein